MNRPCPTVFLDRDGVLIEDAHLAASISQIRLIDGVCEALGRLKKAGYTLVVVTNQPAVARGILTIPVLHEMHQHLNALLGRAGTGVDRFYFCPHHPEATLQDYRIDCECRKPKAGMLLKAALELNLDLKRSFLVGDRISDICAGAKAGCKTILVRSGCHEAPPIVSDAFDANVKPDWEAKNLLEASRIILGKDA